MKFEFTIDNNDSLSDQKLEKINFSNTQKSVNLLFDF